jgi:hypothetical protein
MKFQYRMLDERATGLCTDDVLDRIVEPIEPGDRPMAKQTMRLAIKARNAFSHGAITLLDDATVDSIGHLIVKSVQAMIAGGYHHMVKEAAYFRWDNTHQGHDGFDMQDWDIGERQVFRMVRAVADLI